MYRLTQNLTPQGTPVYRQLKVEDALAYLDQVFSPYQHIGRLPFALVIACAVCQPESGTLQLTLLRRFVHVVTQVKTQFASQPLIYNQFLEIMKSFKSQR